MFFLQSKYFEITNKDLYNIKCHVFQYCVHIRSIENHVFEFCSNFQKVIHNWWDHASKNIFRHLHIYYV